MKNISKGFLITLIILGVLLVTSFIYLWCYEGNIAIMVQKYSNFLGFLTTIIIAFVTFCYFLATKEIANKTAESVKASREFSYIIVKHQQEEQTKKLIREWVNERGMITSNRKKNKLELNNKGDVKGLGKDIALDFIDEYQKLISYFREVENSIKNSRIDVDYYFALLSYEIIKYYETEHDENEKVFNKVKKRLEDNSWEGIEIQELENAMDLVKVYKRALRYKKTKVMTI